MQYRFSGANRSAVHLGESESGLKKRGTMLAGQHRWPIVGGSIRFAGIRPQDFAPWNLSVVYDMACLPPKTLTSQAPRIPPKARWEAACFSDPHPCSDWGLWPMRVLLTSVPLHQARRTTWSSEIPGLIEFDYRCRSSIAAHSHHIGIFERKVTK